MKIRHFFPTVCDNPIPIDSNELVYVNGNDNKTVVLGI